MQSATPTGPTVEDPSELPDGAVPALIGLVRQLARGEHDAARLYAPLQLTARDASLRLAFANVVRDELRHALVAERLLLRLGATEDAAAAAEPRTGEEAALDRAAVHTTPVTDELDGLVLLFLLDRAAGHRLADLGWCRWAPLARAVRSMEHEESGHVTLGNHHVRGLAAQPATRPLVQAAINRWFGPVVNSFGVDDDVEAAAWIQHGLQSRSVADLRDGYIAEVRELATAWKLTLPPWTPPWNGQASAVAAATARHHRLVGG